MLIAAARPAHTGRGSTGGTLAHAALGYRTTPGTTLNPLSPLPPLGGGWCYDKSSCSKRSSEQKSSSKWPKTYAADGIFDASDPRISEANLIYVGYCTSDACECACRPCVGDQLCATPLCLALALPPLPIDLLPSPGARPGDQHAPPPEPTPSPNPRWW